MREGDRFTLGQLLALCSAAALTPALRLLPGLTPAIAGRGAWLSVLLALPGAIGYARFLWGFARRRLPGEDLPALWRRAAGRRAGAAALALLGLWLLFYAAFTLRDSAERLTATVYPQADRRFFILPLGLLAAAAGAGDALRLARMAKLALPLLLASVVLTLLFSLPALRPENLLPPGGAGLLRGAWPTLDTAGAVLVLLFFLSDRLKGLPRFRSVAARIALLGGLMAALVAAVTGVFGHELAARLARPYFSLVRCLVLSRALERPEALAVALWVFSDFLLCAALLLVARRCLGALAGERKWLGVSLGAAALPVACLLAPEAAAFARLSQRLIPLGNAAVCLLLIPGVYALGRLRRRI